MKILYCVGSLIKPGGAERVLITKANYLADVYGYEVTILIASQKNQPSFYSISEKVNCYDMEIENHIPLNSIPFITFYKNIKKLKNIYAAKINLLNPDVIVVIERGYEDFIIPSVKTNARKVRESHSSHQAVALMDKSSKSYLKNFVNKIYTLLYKYQLNKFDEVVLLTKRDQLFRSYLKNTIVIPNVIKLSQVSQKKINSNKVISVGRLDKNKNFIDQILVWSNLVKLFPTWTLHIYGEGEERQNLNKLIFELNLENHVFLEGLTNKIEDSYCQSSFFIFSSLAEGFPMVLVEAMQFGLPVVSYDCPCGPSDIIDDGVNGFLVPVSDLNMLENSILKLIENESLREKMGLKAKQKSTDFKPEVIMPKWDALFKNLKNAN